MEHQTAADRVEIQNSKPRIPSSFDDDHSCIESTVIPWGVLWDIENVQVGIDRTNFMIEKVKEFVKSKQDGRYDNKDPLFICAADFKNQKDSLVKVLQEAKVELHHVLKGKDSADNEIIVSFQKFNSWPVKPAIVVITSDKKLMEKIQSSVPDPKFNCNVFLIYKQDFKHESRELKSFLPEHKRISFDKLMQHNGTTKRHFQKFFELLTSYWKYIYDVKKQKICFKAPEDGQQMWFKNIKEGEAVFYLNSDQKKNAKMDFTMSNSTTVQDMRSSLTFATLILVYNNQVLKYLKKDIPSNKETIGMIIKMSKSLNIFLACMPWWFHYCEAKINGLMDDFKKCASVKDQCRKFCNVPELTDSEIICAILGVRDDVVNKNGAMKYDEACEFVIKTLEHNHSTDSDYISKETLYKMGFTEEKATTIIDNIPGDLRMHLSALEWAKKHVKHLFQNHPLLSSSRDFPHSLNSVTDRLC